MTKPKIWGDGAIYAHPTVEQIQGSQGIQGEQLISGFPYETKPILSLFPQHACI